MIYIIILFVMIFYCIHVIRLRLIEMLRKGRTEEALSMLEMTEMKSD